MNFLKLNSLKNHFSGDYLLLFDRFLSNVPRSSDDRIALSSIANYLKAPYSVVYSLVEKSCELGIITERYVLRCPECGLALKLAETDNLLEVISETSYCYGCELGAENLDLKINNENIFPIYKINK